mmetsp:Transcript_31164/g.74002  ORF Transcript_31164/g.74002 Transcript_31164/m.74002 type:complete len:263 (-) Transcript_31164:61-849(-)
MSSFRDTFCCPPPDITSSLAASSECAAAIATRTASSSGWGAEGSIAAGRDASVTSGVSWRGVRRASLSPSTFIATPRASTAGAATAKRSMGRSATRPRSGDANASSTTFFNAARCRPWCTSWPPGSVSTAGAGASNQNCSEAANSYGTSHGSCPPARHFPTRDVRAASGAGATSARESSTRRQSIRPSAPWSKSARSAVSFEGGRGAHSAGRARMPPTAAALWRSATAVATASTGDANAPPASPAAPFRGAAARNTFSSLAS